MENNVIDLKNIRREYCAADFLRSQLDESPVQQFTQWFKQAEQVKADDVSSMTLATANASGMPSARIVLLKHYDADGFCWYTDYESQKGQDLAENPQAELMFYWYGLERQVRIQGVVEKLGSEQAQQYFEQRPRDSQISAAASHQSMPIASREALQRSVTDIAQASQDQAIVRPERWGGYCLKPTKFEFWQGREGRLHDRFVYQLENTQWNIERLQP